MATQHTGLNVVDGPCIFIRNMSPAIVNAALKQLRGPLGTVKTKSAVFIMFRSLVLATKVSYIMIVIDVVDVIILL